MRIQVTRAPRVWFWQQQTCKPFISAQPQVKFTPQAELNKCIISVYRPGNSAENASYKPCLLYNLYIYIYIYPCKAWKLVDPPSAYRQQHSATSNTGKGQHTMSTSTTGKEQHTMSTSTIGKGQHILCLQVLAVAGTALCNLQHRQRATYTIYQPLPQVKGNIHTLCQRHTTAVCTCSAMCMMTGWQRIWKSTSEQTDWGTHMRP